MILKPKMRVVLLREINDPTRKIAALTAGHVVGIDQHSGQSGVALVQFDDDRPPVYVDPQDLGPEPPRVTAPVGPITGATGRSPHAIAEAAREQIGIALKQGEDDAARLAWLEEVAGFAAILITNGEGGVYLSIHDEYQVNRPTLRAAIDTAQHEYKPED